MSAMIRLYADNEGIMVRTGRSHATLDKAREKAKALRAKQVEIRNDALPRCRSLLTIFVGGVEVAPTTH